MTARALTLVLALLPAGPVLAEGGGEGRTHVRTGVACDRSSGEPVYRELHEERWVDGRLVEDRVSYLRPDGEAFAAKRVDYRVSATAPDFELVDSATGHREALERSGGALVVRYRASEAAPERSATLPSAAPLIADAGFDRFIRRNWDRLVAGEAMVRPFLVPSRLDAVDMRLRRLGRGGGDGGDGDGGDGDGGGGDGGRRVVFELAIDSVLLRLVVPSVRVHYDASTRALLRYEGISNLRGADGGNLDVTIDFPPDGAAGRGCRP